VNGEWASEISQTRLAVEDRAPDASTQTGPDPVIDASRAMRGNDPAVRGSNPSLLTEPEREKRVK